MPRQAGASDEVDITPAMVDAGVVVYVGFMTGAVGQSDLLTEGALVSEIYRSMRATRGGRDSQQLA